MAISVDNVIQWNIPPAEKADTKPSVELSNRSDNWLAGFSKKVKDTASLMAIEASSDPEYYLSLAGILTSAIIARWDLFQACIAMLGKSESFSRIYNKLFGPLPPMPDLRAE